MAIGFEQGIYVGVGHLQWHVDQRSTLVHQELHSPGRLSASLTWMQMVPLWKDPVENNTPC